MILDFVLMSIASQLALALCLFMGWRALNRHSDLAGRLATVREYTSRKARVECARVALERSVAERAALGRTLDRARQIVRDVIDVGDGPQLTIAAIGFVVVTLVLFEGDNALMTLLNGGNTLFGMKFEGWAVGSPWIVASLFAGLHMLVSMAIADPNRPARTIRLARFGALSTGILVFTALWGSMSGRGIDFSSAGWAADAIQWSLWILAGALAVCGGFTSVLASESMRQARLAERVIELETRDEEYARCIETLEREIELHRDDCDDGDRQGATATRVSNVARHVAALFMALLIGSLASPAAAAPLTAAAPVVEAVAQAPAGVPVWLTQVPAPAAEECDIVLDVSESMASHSRLAVAEMLAVALPDIIRARRCRIIRLSAFSGDGPLQPITEVPLPAGPQLDSCETAMKGTSLAQWMYPELKREDARKAHSACEKKLAAAAAAAGRLWSNAVASIGRQLTVLAETPPVGRCTPLYQTTLRALLRSQHVIVGTDGRHTCSWYPGTNGAPWSQPTPPDSSLVFVLSPEVAANDDSIAEASRRATALLQVFPGAVVRLMNEATASYWQRPVALPRSAPQRE